MGNLLGNPSNAGILQTKIVNISTQKVIQTGKFENLSSISTDSPNILIVMVCVLGIFL